jgi:hypothetical protein
MMSGPERSPEARHADQAAHSGLSAQCRGSGREQAADSGFWRPSAPLTTPIERLGARSLPGTSPTTPNERLRRAEERRKGLVPPAGSPAARLRTNGGSSDPDGGPFPAKTPGNCPLWGLEAGLRGGSAR